MHSVKIRAATRLKSSVSYKRPDIRSQAHCVFHDPGNGVYRVRRQRFADVRSGSTIAGSHIQVPIIRLVSIAALSTSFPMFLKLSSITTISSRMVDVELVSSSMVNLFLYLLNNRRNFLHDHLFLHSGISNYVLRHLPCNDLFLMDWVVHGRIKLF